MIQRSLDCFDLYPAKLIGQLGRTAAILCFAAHTGALYYAVARGSSASHCLMGLHQIALRLACEASQRKTERSGCGGRDPASKNISATQPRW